MAVMLKLKGLAKQLGMVCMAFSVFIACRKNVDTVAPSDDNEFLTTVQYKLVNTANPADSVSGTLTQLYDSKGNITLDTSKAFIVLQAHSSYKGNIIIYDTTQHPWANQSLEIQEKGKEHLFFYQPTPTKSVNPGLASTDIPGTVVNPALPSLNIGISRTDSDMGNPLLPIGLHTQVISGDSSVGRLRVVLRHQPNVKNGTYAPGSTDLDVNFNIKIRK